MPSTKQATCHAGCFELVRPLLGRTRTVHQIGQYGTVDNERAGRRRTRRNAMIRALRLRIAVVAVVGILAACAGSDRYRRELALWRGEPVSDFLASWGAADAETEAGGRRVLTWVRERASSYGGSPIRRDGRVVGHTPVRQMTLTCRTHIEVDAAGLIVWTWAEGNDCR
jgi:hypothetical protein